MLERINPVLRVTCLLLAAILLFQLARAFVQKKRTDDVSAATTLSLPLSSHASPASTNSAQKKEGAIPAGVQARIDRITQSEILAPVVRPLPMALLGIAGKDAFIRTPSGQPALMREGEEFGGVKLLVVGTNRVLVEHEAQKKELTVFSGFGGESLMPKEQKAPGETHKQ